MSIIEATFILYLLGLVVIGYLAWRRTGDMGDYVLGGRSLGGLTIGLSTFASGMSGWLLLGLPGASFVSGLENLWLAGGLLLGAWLNWRLVAGRLRRYSELAANSLTLPSFLSERFGDRRGTLRVLAALAILLFFTFYTGAQLVAGGKLFTSVFGYDYQFAVLVGALVVLAYTLFGGFLAVTWTDVVQGVLMLLAVVLTPLIAFTQMDVSNELATMGAAALLDPFSAADGSALGLLAIVSALGWGLGYFGQPHILARFKALKSEAELPVARQLAVGAAGIAMLFAVLVGLAGRALVGADMQAAGKDPETVLIELIAVLFHPLVAGILLVGIMAAIMSTVDSMLLVASAALAEDIAGRTFALAQRRRLQLGRATVLVIGGIATWQALSPNSSVLNLVSYAWAGLGASFGPVLLLSLYWRRCNRYGALAGILSGALCVVLWGRASGGIFDLYELIPAFFLSLVLTWGVSLATAPPGREVEALFDRVRDNR